MKTFLNRTAWALAVMAALLLIGTAGYVLIEHQSVADSFYMTAITLTAVGYEEVFELSPAGRTFTMVLLLAGLSWMGLWFANITSFIVELDLQDALRRRRIMKQISEMRDHIIVCGAGRTGRQVVQEIHDFGHGYVVIERSEEQIAHLREYVPDALVLEGDATHDQTLLDAGIMRAKGLIACLSADTDNLFVCLSARDLAGGLTIVARAYEEETIAKLYRAGADQVVSPNVSSAVQMASILLRPSAVAFLDIATRSADLRLQAEAVPVGGGLAGKTLAEARLPDRTGLIVIAIKRAGDWGALEFNPAGDAVLQEGDEVIVLGKEEQIEALRSFAA